MSESAKSARKAAASKVQRLVGPDPRGAPIDASGYTPPDALDTGVQTGMRPVSKRQFKKGGKVIGKVHGAAAHHHAGRKPRKAGGSAMPPVDRLINRDLKKANEYRDGSKHIGGMKKGGRIHKDVGGGMDNGPMMDPRALAMKRMADSNRAGVPQALLQNVPATKRKHGGHISHADEAADKKLIKKMVKGKALKCDGGSLAKETGTRPTGGRMARKSGGAAGKGKTNVNIMIHPHDAAGAPPMGGMPPKPPMPPMGMPPGPPAGPPPMGGMPPMPPPPMGRKAGGRTYRKEQDMDAGSGSGLGRLEKVQIQKHH